MRCLKCGGELTRELSCQVVWSADGDRILFEDDLGYESCEACGYQRSIGPWYAYEAAQRQAYYSEDDEWE